MLVRHKRFIFTVTFLFAAGAGAYALLATAICRAEVLLTPAQKGEHPGPLGSFGSQFGGLAELVGISMPGSGNIETTVVTLKSRNFIVGFIAEPSMKPVLFHDNQNPERKNWIIRDVSIVARIKRMLMPDEKRVPSEQSAPRSPPWGTPTGASVRKFLPLLKKKRLGWLLFKLTGKIPNSLLNGPTLWSIVSMPKFASKLSRKVNAVFNV